MRVNPTNECSRFVTSVIVITGSANTHDTKPGHALTHTYIQTHNLHLYLYLKLYLTTRMSAWSLTVQVNSKDLNCELNWVKSLSCKPSYFESHILLSYEMKACHALNDLLITKSKQGGGGGGGHLPHNCLCTRVPKSVEIVYFSDMTSSISLLKVKNSGFLHIPLHALIKGKMLDLEYPKQQFRVSFSAP